MSVQASFTGRSDDTQPVELAVTDVRSSSRAHCQRVALTQLGRTCAEVTIWSAADGTSYEHATVEEVPDPASVPSSWDRLGEEARKDDFGFRSHLQERPLEWTEDWLNRPGGAPVYDCWLLLEGGLGSRDAWTFAGFVAIVCDIFPSQAAVRGHTHQDSRYVPLTLSLSISLGEPPDDLDRVFCQAASPLAGGGHASGTVTVRDRSGRPIATSVQQNLLRPIA